jgi:hypothetical protein
LFRIFSMILAYFLIMSSIASFPKIPNADANDVVRMLASYSSTFRSSNPTPIAFLRVSMVSLLSGVPEESSTSISFFK